MTASPIDLVLASRSPRRASLLREIGLHVRAEAPEVDETALPGEAPEAHVLRLAAEKAVAVARRIADARDDTVILAADTVVVHGDRMLGKPATEREAVEMLLSLSGGEHRVLTGVRLERPARGRAAEAVVSTRVLFAPFGEAVARRYVATGEPNDKAGAYGIQGLGALLVASIDGSWSNVVGLPLESLPGLFRGVGFDLWNEITRPTET